MLTAASALADCCVLKAAFPGDDGDPRDALSLCHLERSRAYAKTESKDPENAGCNDAASGNFLENASLVKLLTFRSRLCRAMTAISAILSLSHLERSRAYATKAPEDGSRRPV